MAGGALTRLGLAASAGRRALAGAWAALARAAGRFVEIDGDQWASSFAYNAFFSLFPLVILFVGWASMLFEREAASALIIALVNKHLPMSAEMREFVFGTIAGVVASRGQAGLVALALLIWVGTQSFNTLITATNRAWGTEGSHWWKLPLKSLLLMGAISLVIMAGLWLPMIETIALRLLPRFGLIPTAYGFGASLAPWVVIFLSLLFFYRVAPHRRVSFSQVWPAALCATVLLGAAQRLFLYYLSSYATLNAIYGAFGGVMALLLWIYLSGCVLVFCSCLSATSRETAV